jgi:hypothetical protein
MALTDGEKLQMQIVQSLNILRENSPAILAKIELEAKFHRHKYLELIKEGFDERQALELCKSI